MTPTTLSEAPSSQPTSVERPAPPRRTRRKSGRFLLIAALSLFGVGCLVAAGWAAYSWRDMSRQVAMADKHLVQERTFDVVLKEKGELEAAKSTDIISEVEGRSTIISLIEEGSYVEKGDLLVQLASDAIERRIQEEELKEANAITAFEAARTELEIQRDKNASDIRKADLEIELKQLELEKYINGEWEQQLRDAQIAIDQAEMTLERRQEDFEAAKELVDRNYVTRTEFKEDEFNFVKAEWDLKKAELAKTVLLNYTHKADLRKRQSDVEEAVKERERVKKNADAEETKKLRSLEGKQRELELIQAELAKLRSQLAKCTIEAPTAGFVVYFSGGGGRFMSGDQIREGAEVYERQVLMQLPDTSRMLVKARVHESKTDRLAGGQPATVRVEGVPDRVFSGKVSKIAVVAGSQSRWLNPDLKEYETEITLDPTETPLKPGATAHVEILVQKVENRLAVPVQAIYTKGRTRYAFRYTQGQVEAVPVRLGATGTNFAEISDGLKPGDQILLAFEDVHKQLIADAPSAPPTRMTGPPGSPPPQRGREGGRPAQGEPKSASAPREAPAAGTR